MRWHDFGPWEKAAIVILLLWFTLGWFLAGLFPDPKFIMNLPYLFIFGSIALLTVLTWVSRKLRH